MPGVAGKSGGYREGAGRKVRKASLQIEQEVFVNVTYPDGSHDRGQRGRVIRVGPTEIIIELADGEKIFIAK